MRKQGSQGGAKPLQTELPASVRTFGELARFRDTGQQQQYAQGIHYRGDGAIVA